MKYISGIYALNLRCSLETCGDWHTSSFSWEKLHFWESEGSFFGEYGIEPVIFVPEHEGEPLYQANHIRALLDMLYEQQFERAQGMNEDYICNEKYTEEIFEKVWMMNVLPYWSEIDEFMEREYWMKWVIFKGGKEMKAPKISMKIRLKENTPPAISEQLHQILRKDGLIDLKEECIHYRDAGNARVDMSKFAIAIYRIESNEKLLSAIEEWLWLFYNEDGTMEEYEDILEERELLRLENEQKRKKSKRTGEKMEGEKEMKAPKISMKIRLKENTPPAISEQLHQILRKDGLIDLKEECIHYRDAGNARVDMSKFAIAIYRIESNEKLLSAIEEWLRLFYDEDGTVEEYEDILEARKICKEKEKRWQNSKKSREKIKGEKEMKAPKISMKIRLKENTPPAISEQLHQILRKDGLIDLQEECIHYRDAGNAQVDMSKFAIAIYRIESNEKLLSAIEEWLWLFYDEDGTVEEYEDILEERELLRLENEQKRKNSSSRVLRPHG